MSHSNYAASYSSGSNNKRTVRQTDAYNNRSMSQSDDRLEIELPGWMDDLTQGSADLEDHLPATMSDDLEIKDMPREDIVPRKLNIFEILARLFGFGGQN